jgi:hypothetical protein
MHKEELLALAKNPDFISGVYNYCDRWCERCPLTSRCLLYATEQADGDLSDPEVHDINNEKFWKKLRSIFESTAEMLREWAEEAGVDLESWKRGFHARVILFDRASMSIFPSLSVRYSS